MTVIAAKAAGERVDDVVWDPGYSLCKPESVHDKSAQAGIDLTFQPVTHQQGLRLFSARDALLDRRPAVFEWVAQPPPPAPCRHRLEGPTKW